MKAYFLRRKNLGKGSIKGILVALREGGMLHDGIVVEGYLSDGRQHTPGNEGVYQPSSLPTDADLCIRWGCTATIPHTTVWNKAPGIHQISNKATFRKTLADHDLTMPTWLDKMSLYNDTSFNLAAGVIVRPPTHAQGKNLDVCHYPEEVNQACAKYPGGYYISALINKVREYRVFVLHGRVVWVAEKKPGNPQDIAWNVAQGGVFENVKWGNWDSAVIANALSSIALTDLDFGGVDVMVDADGRAYCLEINSGPSQTSPYRQQCVARAIAWTLNKGVKAEPTPQGDYNWKTVIHPGVTAFSQEG